MFRTLKISTLAIVSSMIAAGAGNAATFSFSGADSDGLGSATLTIDDVGTLDGTNYVYGATLSNTTDASLYQSVLTAFGLNYTGGGFVDILDSYYTATGSFNQGGVSVDQCFENDSGQATCIGNDANEPLQPGMSDTFDLVFDDAVVFESAFVRFQRVVAVGSDAEEGSLKLTETPTPVPVPASLPLLAGGLGLAGFALRRKRKVA